MVVPPRSLVGAQYGWTVFDSARASVDAARTAVKAGQQVVVDALQAACWPGGQVSSGRVLLRFPSVIWIPHEVINLCFYFFIFNCVR